jgi:hypothetical protein
MRREPTFGADAQVQPVQAFAVTLEFIVTPWSKADLPAKRLAIVARAVLVQRSSTITFLTSSSAPARRPTRARVPP